MDLPTNNNNQNNNNNNSNDQQFKADKSFYKQWSAPQPTGQIGQGDINYITNLSFIICSQINNLLSSLSKKTYKTVSSDIAQIINQYGNQAEVFLFRILVDSIDFKDQSGNKDTFKIQLFRDEFSRLMKQPHFISVLCKSFEGLDNITMEFLAQFSQLLKLSPPQEILLGLAISSSLDIPTRDQGEKYLLSILLQTNIKSLPENVLHPLLYKFKLVEIQGGNNNREVLKHIQSLLPPTPSLALSPFMSPVEDLSIPNSKRSIDSSNQFVQQLIQKVSLNNNAVQLIQSVGFTSCSSATALRELLSQFPRLTESDVAQVIGMMSETTAHPPPSSDSSIPLILSFNDNGSASTTTPTPSETESPSTALESSKAWNYTIFVDVVKELYPTLDWSLVIKELDYPGFILHDQRGLTLLLSIFKRAVPNDKFPVHHILDRVWTNSIGQISFIKVALQSDFPFHFSQRKRIEYSALGKVSQTVAHWNSLSLIEILLSLSEIDQEHYIRSRSLFEYPLKHCPELLLMGLSSLTNFMENFLLKELISILFHSLLFNHNYQVHISQLWKEYPNIVVYGMSDIYQKDSSSLSRLLDIAQELKILRQILCFKRYPFIIELAALASQREFLFLERWLQERIKDEGNESEFVAACAMFLSERIGKRLKGTESSISISSAVLGSFYKTLMVNVDQYPQVIGQLLKSIPSNFEELVAQQQQQQAQLNNNNNNNGERRFPEEIEEETNSYFIKLYHEQISVDQIVSILKEYKSSQNSREQEIYQCLLFNLFDEYKFLSGYPEKELRTTAHLFGSLIKNQLISSQALRIALKYVLEALKQPLHSNLFVFGVNSLLSFANRLVEWPQYWSQICSIEHFKNYVNGDLVKSINSIIEATDPSKSSIQLQSPPNTSTVSIQDALDSANDKSLFMSDQQKIQHQQDSTGGSGYTNQSKSSTTSTSSASNTSAPVGISNPPGFNTQSSSSVGGSGGEGDDPNQNFGGGKPNDPKAKAKADKNDSEEPMFTSLPIGTLISQAQENKIIEPEEVVRDKMFFIINNVSMYNLDTKVKEMKELLKPEFYPFLAQYLVVKRVSIEPNFHNVYLTFLDKFAQPNLLQQILNFTQQNINALLKSEKIKTDHAERSLLKNLGGWLGMLTLGKNKPLLQKFISPKELLIYGVENNLLVAVVPFVAKLLDSCQTSKVFKPPNPWVMAIVKTMVEIYGLKESKNNIKFEIELLLSNLKLDINDIKPSTTIRDRREAVARMEEMEERMRHHSSTQQLPSAAELLQNLPNYINYNPASIGNLAQLPLFKKVVPMAFERAVKEIIQPVVERSVAIAVITSRELVSKDFATESDEKKMKKASHLMVQNLAGSLALVTCKDPLRVGMVTHLRSFIQLAITGGNLPTNQPPPELPPQLEQAISTICQDNLDFACSIVERAATEKAIVEIDNVLGNSYMDRIKHRETQGNQPFFDMGYLTTTIYNNLPEPLRPKPGGIQPDQFRVYEDFMNLSSHTNIALAQPPTQADIVEQQQQQMLLQQQQQMNQQMGQPMGQQPQQMQGQPGQQGQQQQFSNNELLDKFGFLLNEVDKAIMRALSTNAQIEYELLHNIIQQISYLVAPSTNQAELLQQFTQKLFTRLCDPEKKVIHEIYLELLEVLRDWDQKVVQVLTNLLLYSPADKKLSKPLVFGLIIHQLISVNDYDQQLASMMIESRTSNIAFEFAIGLLRFCVTENNYVVPSEVVCIMDLLTKMVQRTSPPPEMLLKLIEDVKSQPDDKKKRISRFKQEEMNRDPPGLKEAVSQLLQDWFLFSSANTDQKSLIQYLNQVLQLNMMKNEIYFQKFFRMGLEWAIEKYMASYILEQQQQNQPNQQQQQSLVSYHEIDSYCKFVVLMVKHNDPTKLAVLTKVLAMLIKVLTKDYETNTARFNQRPYLRVFENLMIDLNAPDPLLDQASIPILYCFVNALSTLQPQKYPAFCFAWLDLISHRSFMPKLLSKQQQQKLWFHTLLVQHFKFLDPFLRGVDSSEPLRLLYKGTLKILLVLLHDFPEFLCEFHFSFCDVIPTTCIQLRNLILSAFPRNMRLPDPFTPNLKVDLLPDINQPPKILSNFTASLKGLKNEIDNYLKNRAPYSFLTDLKKYLLLPEPEDIIAGTKYNAPLINSMVLYIGQQAIPQMPQMLRKNNGSGGGLSPSQSAPMDIFHRLIVDLDAEGRYLFFNAITNQLRYPNNHTHYFSCVLLYLFAEANQEIIKEQITRVLLERLISNKPHPWGLLITFIELIKNPRYNFWSHNFTRIAPEIEQLFQSVAKSCMSRESSPQQIIQQ